MRCRIIIAFAAILLLVSFVPMFSGPMGEVEMTGKGLMPMPITTIAGLAISVVIITGLTLLYKRTKTC